MRNIIFPSVIDAIAMDPGEHVFYAGGRDGKIYIASLNAQGTSGNYGMHIIGTLSDHRFVNSLMLCMLQVTTVTYCHMQNALFSS